MDKVGDAWLGALFWTENALAKHYAPRDIVTHLLRPRTLLYGLVLLVDRWQRSEFECPYPTHISCAIVQSQ